MAKSRGFAQRLLYLLVGLSVAAGIATVAPFAGATGATYYVSASGSDSNPGTMGAPFKTIQKGASILNAGDTLYIRGGTYLQTSTLSLTKSGTSAARITIASYPGETAVISGDTNGNSTADPTDTPGNFYQPLVNVSGSYVTVTGLEVAFSGGWGIKLSASNITVSKSYVHNTYGTGIQVIGTNNIVEDNKVVRTADSNYCGGTDGVRKCNGDWQSGIAIGQAGTTSPTNIYATVRGNYLEHVSGEGIIVMHTDSGTIEDNVLADVWGPDIDADQSSYWTVQRNLMYWTADTTWWRGGTKPSGGMLFSSEGINGYSVIGHDNVVINNIVVGAGTGLSSWGKISTHHLINYTIANNTFVEMQGDGTQRVFSASTTAPNVNTRIADNVVLQSTGTMASISTNTGITWDHNLWSRTPPSEVSSSTDVVANPLLADPNHVRNAGQVSADWYKLTTSSPAIGKASTLSQVTDDYFGDVRTSPDDIGAHEYGSSAVALAPTSTPVPTGMPTLTATPAPTNTPVPPTTTATIATSVTSTPAPTKTTVPLTATTVTAPPPTSTPLPQAATSVPPTPAPLASSSVPSTQVPPAGSTGSNNGNHYGQEKTRKPTPAAASASSSQRAATAAAGVQTPKGK